MMGDEKENGNVPQSRAAYISESRIVDGYERMMRAGQDRKGDPSVAPAIR